MLRDDAIREGLIKPTKKDIERMNLLPGDITAETESFLEHEVMEEPKKKGRSKK